ncbi:F-box domain-containing protein [Artemisia annua]|uniref:F-box domain-containing protein n=1 Tax=Artemisia annua TaxID=35608 RepID=A0A2U1LX49_ARTAN|nr:F-box domain-containing protein [Artemisia annua]
MAKTPDQQQHPILRSMANTPDDVLHELFIRLPAKLVARMRCVCKSWNGFLTTPSFIKSHLDHSKNTNKEILLEFEADGYPFFDFENPCTAEYSQPLNLEIPNFLKFPVNTPPFDSFYLIGSVNGLICFVDEGSLRCPTPGVHIWNPSLSAFLTLPPYSTGSKCKDKYLWFGFDPKTDDYKVVKVIRIEGADIRNEWPVEVYSMRKGVWEVISERFPSHVRNLSRNELGVGWHDGRVHWLGYNYMTQQLTIVAFDLDEKTFCEIPVPDCKKDCRITTHQMIFLGMWNDKLCLMSYNRRGNLQVWLMNKYKVAESWVGSYFFNKYLLDLDESPFRFILNNESRFLAYGNRLCLYDPAAKSFKYMGELTRPYSIIVRYVDSLVWVAPSKSGSPVATAADSKLKRKINVIDGES